ncbi:putative pre-rRNA processing protein Utp22 [Diplocarpon rosae]|nr:putative pre-rRNA processing protein Utp22 [Diplocarpon rosae]
MSTIHTKRRKLDSGEHRSPSVSSDDSHSSDDDDGHFPVSKSTPPAQIQTKTPSKAKRTRHDHDPAIYAGGLYKSSLFKLQVDELLAEVQLNYEKRLTGVDDLLRKLKESIEEIGNRDATTIQEASKILHKSHQITIPFPDPKPDDNAAYKLAYEKPSSINVVGSYPSRTMIKSEGLLSIDMVVIMPASIFQEKDYLNYRYFYKRAYYLSCIAAGLDDTKQQEFTLSFQYLNGNSLHPILAATPKPAGYSKSAFNYQIYIIPAAPPSFFSKLKLQPNKNAVRPKNSPGNEAAALLPTPFYNASLMSDCSYEPYLKLLHSSVKSSPGFKEACILGRTWLRQRGFGGNVSKGGFGHFEWAATMALLLKGGGPKGHSVISSGYSSYQMFKAVLQFFASSDLAAKPVIFEAKNTTFSKSNVPILFDGIRGLNILYKMTSWSYQLLCHEAKISLAMLNDTTFDQFESIFIIRESQNLQRFDSILKISVPHQPSDPNSCDHISSYRRFSNKLFDVLREGLMDRVELIHVQEEDSASWSLRTIHSATIYKPLLVSVVFNPANINRLVDHGPAAEEKKKAAKFQKFWGEKAELRRFKDGSILESLIWSPGSAHSIFQDIVKYLIKHHFGDESAASLSFTGEGFDKFLPGLATNIKHFDGLREAYRIFEKQVRDLEGLPLQIKQLSSVCPQLSNSSTELPVFSSRQPMSTPADVLVLFEGSGRWPDDIVAIQRTKIAFLLKIGNLLEEADNSISTRVGLENEYEPLRNCAFLDVIYDSGAVFRLRIHNDREQTLLERQIKDKSGDHRDREAAVSALSIYKKDFKQLPMHTQSISTHCTRFPLLSPTIRITKIWFQRHMLLGHISEELIELLVTRTFLQPFPWRAPSSVMTGFLRTLLFVSRWDWRLTPLIIDFTGTMTSQEVDTVNTRMEAWRKIDPSMNRTVMFVASNHDLTGTCFTDKGPSKMVAARMTALARSACKLVKEKDIDLEPRSLFSASTNDYDFVIHISPKFSGKEQQKEASKSKFKNLEMQVDVNEGVIGYQPVALYLEELQQLYTNSIVFFCGSARDAKVGGLWNPQNAAAREFKVSSSYATKPAGPDKAGDVVIDKKAILAEIARLGGDIVSRVELIR